MLTKIKPMLIRESDVKLIRARGLLFAQVIPTVVPGNTAAARRRMEEYFSDLIDETWNRREFMSSFASSRCDGGDIVSGACILSNLWCDLCVHPVHMV